MKPSATSALGLLQFRLRKRKFLSPGDPELCQKPTWVLRVEKCVLLHACRGLRTSTPLSKELHCHPHQKRVSATEGDPPNSIRLLRIPLPKTHTHTHTHLCYHTVSTLLPLTGNVHSFCRWAMCTHQVQSTVDTETSLRSQSPVCMEPRRPKDTYSVSAFSALGFWIKSRR